MGKLLADAIVAEDREQERLEKMKAEGTKLPKGQKYLDLDKKDVVGARPCPKPDRAAASRRTACESGARVAVGA